MIATPSPGTGRYLDLLHGNFRRLPAEERTQFLQALSLDARRITDAELEFRLQPNWRSRITAAWMIGLDHREQFRDRIRELPPASELDLATRAAGLAHQAPARRLIDRPLITENPYALWPYHLHDAIRTAVHTDDHSEDRWPPTDWHQAATRALAALGDQWATTAALAPSRMLLVACLRQGLRLARDHRLTDLSWLTPLIETAVAFHHAVRGAHDDLTATIDRLRKATANGDFTYYVHIATAMGDLPQPDGPAIRWLDAEHTVRPRWRTLVIARRERLHAQR
ncbi:DUF6000 family protein [Streptomyces sp. NPDC048483]|uniref:DUF6000 family protein n=1 Tax=Streptomyces sp. NPDC048483 TaxID=3154927 RepID=UPI00341695EE